MSTIRQQIVDALVGRLKTITTANGYASDIGGNVYSWFPENLSTEVLPLLMVNDLGDTLTDSGQDQIEHSLRIQIEGHIAAGTTTDQAIRSLIGDIAKVVMDPQDRTLGGLCDTMQLLDGGTIQLEQQAEQTVGAATLALGVTYRTDRGDWSEKIS
jgi:hypothetical protein